MISLRGVDVHNLRHVDLDLPHRQLVVFCGLSGSGKTSLAVDTLYAEGQRRYIESFSPYTRQFLERLEKPAADQIDGIPPAVAVTRKNTRQSSRATVGTATEIADYLRLLYAKVGQVVCRGCGKTVHRDLPERVAERLSALPDGTRYLVAFALGRSVAADAGADTEAADEAVQQPSAEQLTAELREDGFVRAIVGGRTLRLDEETLPEADRAGSGVADADAKTANAEADEVYVVVDRLQAGRMTAERIRDSLETAYERGDERCYLFVENGAASSETFAGGTSHSLDGKDWHRFGLSTGLTCEDCQLDYPLPEPRLYSFNSPLGACPACEGFGNIIDIDMDRVVPDDSKSLREGAVAPWNTPAYAHELEELLALADDYELPVDVPYRELSEDHVRLIREGVPERDFGGLFGFFNWLERRKYKMHLRVFLSRWRSYRPCEVCGGTRLRAEALATQVGGLNIAELTALKVDEALAALAQLSLEEAEYRVGRMMLEEVTSRLRYLQLVGLGYLTLDRTVRTLSDGEAQRVTLTTALGSSLVNILYVLDEPSIGLHPRDVGQLVSAIEDLRDRGNSVVVVEHEEALLKAADQLVEVGPGAGQHGGQIVFQGTPEEMLEDEDSLTGDYLAGRRGVAGSSLRREPNHGWIRLAGARGHNLRDITVEFPLGMLCVVTGVSGAGKSTLVEQTLYPAICRRLGKDVPPSLPYDDVFGDGQIDDCMLIDQSPIGRSPRSNPVTYIKAFDEIRAVMAATVEARTNNFTAGHFSFNVDGGRCNTCKGDGSIEIDMQFLADVYMTCPQCNGQRYRPEILGVKYRGRSIADILEMTIREAFTFFRGRPKVQARLKRLIDVGLEYIRLGQPANTLSGGEAQRLKLATYISSTRRGRTLFILDEPTTGLHYSDVVQLLDCFDALISVGHSLIVVEHNLQMMRAADYIIDLGPGAAEDGGRVVAMGTPEIVSREKGSVTGEYLAEALAESYDEQTA
ncbi:MAG: excinuclease ABC subunit A [Planctomycetota bacterium]|nr:MAG: excinuclease ABC subunit A [Planctomycetota bacterium]REJ91209.1 MAG: excinuclease ABC subunit A [Planctomycetota bacterium]REK22210.1 MAG: excinuclease ABC subunit A [Planctomycetota bacterium]REK44268.1 MAG: excinuclease ABC subunit A [Planctomycetota bacterium]